MGNQGVGLVKTIIPHVRLMSLPIGMCGSHVGILWATSGPVMYPIWALCGFCASLLPSHCSLVA